MIKPIALKRESISLDLAASVQLRAVLETLCGPIAQGQARDRDVIVKTQAVHGRWRKRVVELSAVRCAVVVPDKRAERAWDRAPDCIPAFFTPRRRGRLCRLDDICPHCWGRRAATSWASIDWSFFRSPRALGSAGADRSLVLGRSVGFDLIERSASKQVPFQRLVLAPGGRGVESQQTLAPLLEEIAGRLAVVPGGFPRAWQGLFRAVIVGLGQDAWSIESRELWMVRAGFTPHQVESTRRSDGLETTLLVHRQPSRTRVMEAEARAWRYPSSLMAGDAEPIA
jgi:hypothetical protein